MYDLDMHASFFLSPYALEPASQLGMTFVRIGIERFIFQSQSHGSALADAILLHQSGPFLVLTNFRFVAASSASSWLPS